MSEELYSFDDRKAALVLWKSASRVMSGYETVICQTIAENNPVSAMSFARFLELKQELSEYLSNSQAQPPDRVG